ncbi:MAG: FCSD flavin-binding domain-containing protein [Sulfuricaulis sp.]|uniref:FCSD flavin-binding domain-containing protein n=1 Tax=Sulfuricaulis sp. TaxID=2003553 RepID=UPI003C66B366
MSKITRRDFLKIAGAASAAGALGYASLAHAAEGGKGIARVVVVGGGFGGATCAKYLRRLDPGVAVTLIEPSTKFITCPFSNLVLGGLRDMNSITQNYDALKKKHGVNVMRDTVTAIDADGKKLKLKSGKTLSYDRLVVSPGIDFKWDAVEGYNEKAVEVMPHAWNAGPQTVLLQKKLNAMKNGGTFILVSPPNPFRCPPGPYERASMVAHYLKEHKPKSKIIILDAKDAFSKQGLFQDGWKKIYGDMIEWVPGAKGGTVKKVNVKKMTLETELDKHKADVVNFIPAQTAGKIALASGLADDKGWCPVDPKTFESKLHPGIHVIGDSSIAGALPKSGFAASSEAKMCAAAIVALFKGETPAENSLVNTCYSLIAPQYGISVAGVYKVTEKGITEVPGAGGVSPKDAPDSFREQEAKYGAGWYASITSDIWG